MRRWKPFGAPLNWSWFIVQPLPRHNRRAWRSSTISKCFITGSAGTALWVIKVRLISKPVTTELMNQTFPNQSLAAPQAGGLCSQGGAQQGTRARGEQYLDGTDRSLILAAQDCLASQTTPKIPSDICPLFRSKP